MPDILVRDLDTTTVKWLTMRAEKNKRSRQAELKEIISEKVYGQRQGIVDYLLSGFKRAGVDELELPERHKAREFRFED